MCRIFDRTVQRRLLQQHDLTFDKSMEIALASEAAEKDSKRLNPSSTSDKDNQIGKVKDVPPKCDHNPKCGKPSRSGKRQQGTKQSKQDCSRCVSMAKSTAHTRNTSVTTARRRVIP